MVILLHIRDWFPFKIKVCPSKSGQSKTILQALVTKQAEQLQFTLKGIIALMVLSWYMA